MTRNSDRCDRDMPIPKSTETIEISLSTYRDLQSYCDIFKCPPQRAAEELIKLGLENLRKTTLERLNND